MSPRASTKKRAGEVTRDQKRKEGGPRMHGRGWHKHAGKDFEKESMAGAGAVLEGEGSKDKTGMGVRRVRRKRMTPVGKGIKPKTRKAQGGRSGMKRTGRGGNPG